MSEIIDGGNYHNYQQMDSKSVIRGDYSFIKTFIFFGLIPFFLLSGALAALQTNLLHQSLVQGEIINMMLFRVAALFLLGSMVVYFIFIVAGLWRSGMNIKNETLRLTAKTITIFFAVFWLVMFIYLIKGQFEYLVLAFKHIDYFKPQGGVNIYLFGLILVPYIYLLSDEQLVDFGLVSKQNLLNKKVSDNGKLALLLVGFIIIWLLTLVFLPNDYDEKEYIFKGEPTFSLPNGYIQANYANNLNGYFIPQKINVKESNAPKESGDNFAQLTEESSIEEAEELIDSNLAHDAQNEDFFNPQELPRCYTVVDGSEKIYHGFKKGECVDD